jgi:hypothetical protein
MCDISFFHTKFLAWYLEASAGIDTLCAIYLFFTPSFWRGLEASAGIDTSILVRILYRWFMKLVAGKKYRIKTFDVRPGHWNTFGKMDHWAGKMVTVKTVWNAHMYQKVRICGDDRRHGSWTFRNTDFEWDYLEEDLFEI